MERISFKPRYLLISQYENHFHFCLTGWLIAGLNDMAVIWCLICLNRRKPLRCLPLDI